MLDTGGEARQKSHQGDVWLVLRRHDDDREGDGEGREEGWRRQGIDRDFHRESLDRTLGVVCGVLRSAVRLADQLDHVLLLLRAPPQPDEATSRGGGGGTRERARRAARGRDTDQAPAGAVAAIVANGSASLQGYPATRGVVGRLRDFHSQHSASCVLNAALSASTCVYCRLRKLAELTKLYMVLAFCEAPAF